MTDAPTPSAESNPPDSPSQPVSRPALQAAPPLSYDSTVLFQGSRVIVISHAGENYRLLVTRNNRLILQK